ncbi:ArsA family ATPase [Streptomyces sp. B3I8]|uniref:ArsA family ATPase n=1 Tax=Streptomyces sp. B3I8 TaxID=3042303 RepID=UPI002783B49F|nr:ArsA-related P-loop ATPase [Streptomyces sp. B3I8]MDQ0786484.1 arsenite-transporting ATPase [Streptomyces sp. B3I8]
MRTLLVTGPGGSGRTTVAAGAALRAARLGVRTLLLSADPADTPGAALGTPTHAGSRAVEGVPCLTARRPDADTRFRDDLLALQTKAASALDLLGAARLDAEELTPLPGATELALLGAVRDAALSGDHDLIVVDLPPAPQALALLALPEQLRRYLRRLLPPGRQAARALRPVLGRLAGVPVPGERLYEAAARWDTSLGATEAVLADPGTTAWLVAEPGPAGADAVRTATTGLALHALRLDAVIANRVLPEPGADTWSAGLTAQQRKTTDEWRETYGSDAVHCVPHLGRDPRGTDDLAALRLPGPAPDDPAPAPVEWPVTEQPAEDGRGGGVVLVWHLPLPGAVREELDLVRRGDELILTVGRFHRIVPLPSALRRCTVVGAALREGELRVRFAPDPELWPGRFG